MSIHAPTLTFHARGLASSVAAVREALREQKSTELHWLSDEPEALCVEVQLARGVVPDLSDLDPIDLPGLELAVVRSMPQDDPLPPVRVARAWAGKGWHKTQASRPFTPLT